MQHHPIAGDYGMTRFEDKVVIVTGAARGMGKAIAKAFAKEKASVVLVDMNTAAVERIEKEVAALGAQALGIKCDVSNSSDVQTAISRVMEKFGRIDILVNNAGVLHTTRPLEEIPEDEWDLVLNVNLKGVFSVFQRGVAHNAEQRLWEGDKYGIFGGPERERTGRRTLHGIQGGGAGADQAQRKGIFTIRHQYQFDLPRPG